MAVKKAGKADKAEVVEKAEKASKPEYGIQYIAEQLNKEPHLVRIQLRRAEIEKIDGRYAWPTKAAADAVVKSLQAKPAKAEKAAEEVAEKPAKKGLKKAA